LGADDAGKKFYVSRREFLRYSLAGTIAVWAGTRIPHGLGIDQARAQELFSVTSAGDPASTFPQSVASGEPQTNGIVLWTRLTPQSSAAQVAFQISANDSFKRPLVQGVIGTSGAQDWTVKTQVSNKKLSPGTLYYYRFIYNGMASRTGRFKTLPAANANLDRVRLAYISCQDYTNGYYTALAYLAREEVDYVVHLDDYIYETVNEESFQGGGPPERQFTFPDGGNEALTLRDYRFAYAKYRSDANLQAVHERFAFITIWDDHEFANDAYQDVAPDAASGTTPVPQRREAANQAWAEYTPTGVPYNAGAGPLDELRIYRSFRFGNLAELVMTDERLYRDPHPCGEGTQDRYATAGCPERTDPDRTMLGPDQLSWFLGKVTNSPCTWKLWGNEVMVMQLKVLNTYLSALFPPTSGEPQPTPGPDGSVFLTLDQWDGWPAERDSILRRLRTAGVKNFVTITGDIHTFFAGYLRENNAPNYADFDQPYLPPGPPTDAVGTCFVCGSVTSSNLEELATLGEGGPPLAPNRGDVLTPAVITSNPHIRYMNSSGHGYNLLEIRPQALVCTMKSVDTIKQPQANLTTLKTFRVPANQVVIQEATTQLPV
jgi:alkaline phosphatase D